MTFTLLSFSNLAFASRKCESDCDLYLLTTWWNSQIRLYTCRFWRFHWLFAEILACYEIFGNAYSWHNSDQKFPYCVYIEYSCRWLLFAACIILGMFLLVFILCVEKFEGEKGKSANRSTFTCSEERCLKAASFALYREGLKEIRALALVSGLEHGLYKGRIT